MNGGTDMNAVKIIVLGLAILATGTAQAGTDGRYTTQDGYYSINVEFTGDGLIVTEPNKTSPYKRNASGDYEFYNDNTRAWYAIHVADDKTLIAYKPGINTPRNGGTRLMLAQAAATAGDIENTPEYSHYTALAEKYAERAESGNDAHVWTACAAAAFSWAMMSKAEAEAYATVAVSMLKPIMVNATRSPCQDVIPDSIWLSAP